MSQHISYMAIALATLVGCGARGSATTEGSDARCEPGVTRECIGPAACRGGQQCGTDGEWGICDCGAIAQSSTGGQSSTSLAKSSTSDGGDGDWPTTGKTSLGGVSFAGQGNDASTSLTEAQGGETSGGEASRGGATGTAASGGESSGGNSGSKGGSASGGKTSASVGGSSAAPNRAPSIVSLNFSHTDVKTGDYLWVNVKATDPDSDRITYTYAWTCDGKAVGTSSMSLSSEYFKRGTEIRVTVTPSDGKLSGPAVTSDPLIVQNAAPAFDSYPMVSPYETVDDAVPLKCETLAQDPDGDALTYSYVWYVNDVASSHTGAELPASATSLGERWSCAVTVTDGFPDGSVTGTSGQARVTTQVQGIIRTNTTWLASSSPYHVTSRIQIAAGTTLTIEPGVKVYGNSNALEVWGSLSVVGTKEKPILLSGLYLTDNSSAEAPAQDTFAFVEFSECGFFQPAQNASLNVSDCVFRDNWYAQLLATGPTAGHRFERNVFRGCGSIESHSPITLLNNVFAGSADYCSNTVYAYAALTATYNSFLFADSADAGFDVALGSQSADMRSNFWGGLLDTAVPERIYDNTDDLNIAGVADYLPTLTTAHADTPPTDKTYFPDGI